MLNEKTRNQYINEVRDQYKEVRESYLNENENKKLLSYSEATKLKPGKKHFSTKLQKIIYYNILFKITIGANMSSQNRPSPETSS